jgi:L-serine dehydratase
MSRDADANRDTDAPPRVFEDEDEVPEMPDGVDRRQFLMRSAVISAAALMTGRTVTPEALVATAAQPPAPAKPQHQLSPDLEVVKASKGPVLTTIEEFYKVGPGPSSSHTIGPMRITYDFYQRCTKLPKDQLDKATALKVNLFGSLSATGKGHGTERAALAGLVGKEPATVEPASAVIRCSSSRSTTRSEAGSSSGRATSRQRKARRSTRTRR